MPTAISPRNACGPALPDAGSPAEPAASGPPACTAIAVHAIAVPVALGFVAVLPGAAPYWPWLAGACAAALGAVSGLASWWIPINAGFVPALVGVLALDLPPQWFLASFAVLLLSFWSAARGQVPFFLSSRAAGDALAALLPHQGSFRMADLGCASGGLIARLAEDFPEGRFLGVERSPLPFAVAWLRVIQRRGRCVVRCADLWQVPLADFDVVYAYLSPVPMGKLWRKAQAEMRPGTLFVSNSFAVPGVAPDAVVETGDALGSRLLVWRM